MTEKFVPPFKRRNYGRSHGYVDGNGQKMPGVTSILSDGMPKQALINWAANATAEYAIDNWDELGDQSVAQRLKTLQGARYSVTDKAKRRGTEVHGYAERLVKGEKVTGIPQELRGHVEAYVRFLDEFEVEPVIVEASIASYKYGYAGTLDLVADLTLPKVKERVRGLWDVKTNEKGIYGETALQLAAYRYADVYLDEDGQEQPMADLGITRCGAIHVTSESARLIPTFSDEQTLRFFRYAQQIAQWSASSRDLVGAEVDPPRESRIASVEWREPEPEAVG